MNKLGNIPYTAVTMAILTGETRGNGGIAWLLVGVALLSNACVVTTEQLQALQQDVRSIRRDINTLTKNRVATEERLRQIEVQLMGVKGGPSQLTDVVARLEELAVETRMVQGKLEENSYRLSELSQRVDETKTKVVRLRGDARGPGKTPPAGQAPTPSAVSSPPSLGRGAQSPAPGETAQPGVSPSTRAVTGQPLTSPGGGFSSPQPPAVAGPRPPVMQGALPAPEEVYEGALTAYMQGNYDLAISGFKTYLTFFPKTLLEDRAQFWLAETHYSKGKNIEAIRQYDLLIGKYPKSRKLPAAYLKKAYAYSEIGEKSRALATLKELRNRFPNTREARLAEPAIMDLE